MSEPVDDRLIGLSGSAYTEAKAAIEAKPEEVPRALEREHQDAEPEPVAVLSPVDGATLLEDIAVYISRYVACTRAQLVAIVLWVVHGYALDAAETTARLAVLSAEKRSGKTRLLETLELLVRNVISVANISPAALFHLIESQPVVLLVDEVDAIFGPKAANNGTGEELRGLLNAGYRRGATVARVVGEGKKMTVKLFPIFAPVALAGLHELPDTLSDRSVIIRLRRRAPGEHVEPFRRREALKRAEPIRVAIVAWTTANMTELGDARPEVPPELSDRMADCWEPMLAIADAAGGDWPTGARAAARAVSGDTEPDDDTIGVRLFSDIRDAFGDDDRLWTTSLLEKLIALEEAPWADWYGKPLDPRRLARMLKPYQVRSRDVRIGDVTKKGYLVEDMFDAWSRYLPPGSATRATSATPRVTPTSAVALVADVADVAAPGEGLVVRRGFDLGGEGGAASADFGDDLFRWGVPDERAGVVVPV